MVYKQTCWVSRIVVCTRLDGVTDSRRFRQSPTGTATGSASASQWQKQYNPHISALLPIPLFPYHVTCSYTSHMSSLLLPPRDSTSKSGLDDRVSMSRSHKLVAALTLLFFIGFGDTTLRGSNMKSRSSTSLSSTVIPQPTRSFLTAHNATYIFSAATMSSPGFAAGSAGYDAWSIFERGSGGRLFSRDEMLQCLVTVGGLGLVGDSTLRELTSALLEYLGRSRIVVLGNPWVNQRATEEWPNILMPDGSVGIARLRFRFAKNTWPDLGERVEEITLPPHGSRAVLVHSGFWDINWQEPLNSITDVNFFSTYVQRVSKFLIYIRDNLVPRLDEMEEQQGHSSSSDLTMLLPPRRWLWRTTNPSFFNKLDDGRRHWLTTGRAALVNEFATQAIIAVGEVGEGEGSGRSTHWELYDVWKMMPPELLGGEPDIVDSDGYHPSRWVSTQMAHRLMNQLCGKRIGRETLEGLAGGEE